jgi:hypothetical protein
MNLTRRLNIRTLIISVALFIVGQFIFKPFFEFLEPGFDLITFNVIEIQKGIRTSLLFSSTLFLIPIYKERNNQTAANQEIALVQTNRWSFSL